MSTWEACGEDSGGMSHDVRPRTLKHQFQGIAQQNSAYDRSKNPESGCPLTRHDEIDGYRAYDDAKYDITAQGGDVPSHLFNPRRPDGVGHVIDAAKKEKDRLIEFCRVALNYLLGNMTECKHEARNRENGHQRPDFRSVRAH